MRTTLNIADDVLQAARELARREKKTAGEVISELVRKALAGASQREDEQETEVEVLGFRPFPRRGAIVTDEHIDRLRDDGPY
jgi:hypothetical protein